jgi:hypothetical protein
MWKGGKLTNQKAATCQLLAISSGKELISRFIKLRFSSNRNVHTSAVGWRAGGINVVPAKVWLAVMICCYFILFCSLLEKL